MAGFLFGGDTGVSSAQELARKREIVNALLDPSMVMPQTFGEGLTVFGRAIAGKLKDKKLAKQEDAERARVSGQFDAVTGALMGGQGGQRAGTAAPQYSGPAVPMPPPDPNTPHAIGNDAMSALGKPAIKTEATPEAIRAGLVARGLPEHVADGFVMNMKDESGLNPGINEIAPLVPGSRGGFGLYQLTGPRRRAYEAFAAERGVPVDDVDAQLDFLMAELQGPEAKAAGVIMGTKSPGEAGAAIVNEFLRPAEAHRAKREAEYLGMGGGQPAMGDVAQLSELAANPYLPEGQRAVVNALLAQAMTPPDPLAEIELQKAQIGLAQMQNPGQAQPEALVERQALLAAAGVDPASPEGQQYILTGKMPGEAGDERPAAFASLDMQAQAAGLEPGTPEYQAFMMNGGGSGTPAAFTALDMQARAAGFEPGTPEYQEFMATRGAGLAAEATTRGKAQAEAELAAPADIAAAETTLSYIGSLRDHPGRQAGSGASSWIGGIPGTDAREFQLEVERLKAGAFLTAIDQLKGMGALSNAEGQTATAAIAALDPNGTEEGFLKRLEEYEQIVARGLERARKRQKATDDVPAEAAAPEAAPTASTAPVAITSDAEYDALPSGAIFVGPDGVTRRKP